MWGFYCKLYMQSRGGDSHHAPQCATYPLVHTRQLRYTPPAQRKTPPGFNQENSLEPFGDWMARFIHHGFLPWWCRVQNYRDSSSSVQVLVQSVFTCPVSHSLQTPHLHPCGHFCLSWLNIVRRQCENREIHFKTAHGDEVLPHRPEREGRETTLM